MNEYIDIDIEEHSITFLVTAFQLPIPRRTSGSPDTWEEGSPGHIEFEAASGNGLLDDYLNTDEERYDEIREKLFKVLENRED